MTKRILSLFLLFALLLSFSACTTVVIKESRKNKNTEQSTRAEELPATAALTNAEVVTSPGEEIVTAEDTKPAAQVSPDFKIGLICLHDEIISVDDYVFIKAINEVKALLGLTDGQVVIKRNIPESNECYDAARDLAESGCKVIFADSFGHEDYMIRAAREYPEVQFCSYSGYKAHTEKQPNYHNAYARIYEGRFLTGVAAGLKLNEMIASGTIAPEQAVLGYAGAFPYAEVISDYTAFFLGARSVCPSATMKVSFAASWFDQAREQEAATTLINAGCVLISQHSASGGAPRACAQYGVPNVSYAVDTAADYPNTALITTGMDWAPYFEMIIKLTDEGKGAEIPYDWAGGIAEGAVKTGGLNDAVAAKNTRSELDACIELIKSGKLKVFDTGSFTVNGETLTSYLADVDYDNYFTGETEAIRDGYFHECEYRSAPYFDITIDGIQWINNPY